MRVSVIIPVLRKSDHLLDTLKKLHRDPYENKEIIVIIDEPDPVFMNQVRNTHNSDTKVLINPTRVGKSNASNKGVDNSTGELLFFLDSDNWIPDYEDRLISKILQQGEQVLK